MLDSSLRPAVVGQVQVALMAATSGQAWALAAATLGPRDGSSTMHEPAPVKLVCNSLRPVASWRNRFLGVTCTPHPPGAGQCTPGQSAALAPRDRACRAATPTAPLKRIKCVTCKGAMRRRNREDT